MAAVGNWRVNDAAVDMNKDLKTCSSFSRCAAKLQHMVYRDTDESRNEISAILDEINAIDYSSHLFQCDEVAVANLLRSCCHLLPIHREDLVAKLCLLIQNLINRQQLVLVHHCDIMVEYLLTALRRCSKSVHVDLFRALATVVFENTGRTTKFHEELVGKCGILHNITDCNDANIRRAVIQCLENICLRSSTDEVYMSVDHQTLCVHTLLVFLQSTVTTNTNQIMLSKVLISALKAIHNLLTANKSLFSSELTGQLLAALQTYMFYGLPNAPSVVPNSLSSLSLDDPNLPLTPKSRPSANQQQHQSSCTSPSNSATGPKPSSKRSKNRRNKGKKATIDSRAESFSGELDKDGGDGCSAETMGTEFSQLRMQDEDGTTGVWAALANSDSDFSDAEYSGGSGGAAIEPRGKRCSSARVRLHALACFNAFIKATERRVMFAYWPSFIPDNSDVGGATTQGHTLLTVVMKDPSAKVKVAALSVLAALVDGSKQFLMAAEDSDQYRVAPFTSFSVVVGRMIKEMHRCLLLMLASSETTTTLLPPSMFVVMQVLKCLAVLIANVPYQRLRPGLLSSVVKHIRPYLTHRDPNIRVACLTCLGSIISTPTPLLEVCHIIEPVRPSHRVSELSGSSAVAAGLTASFTADLAGGCTPNPQLSPGFTTPPVIGTSSSGARTPVTPGASDIEGLWRQPAMSWLVRLCIRCVTPQLAVDADGLRQPLTAVSGAQPMPVRLEALQVLSLLAKGYFAIVRKSLVLMKELIESCLMETDSTVQLHAAKLLGSIGHMLLQDQQQQQHQTMPDIDHSTVDISQALDLWLAVLSGPLQNALHTGDSQCVRSTVCDCLAEVGPDVFIRLPANIRTLCITLLLGLASDVDHHVRAAAIRALGCCVLYPSLREDVSFVADTSNALITAASEPTLFVRWRVAWSLANLSDALILNRTDNNTEFMEDFSCMLLSKLFKTSVHLCSDNDKARYNAVRAVGNLLRYIPQPTVATGRLKLDVEAGLQAIVKSITTGSVKVRWNACYAIANVFGNEILHSQLQPHLPEVFVALAGALKTSRNFKVRISAATAMAAPCDRRLYGTSDTYLVVWQSLVDVISGLDNLDADFAEYKYRDNLVGQICSTLIHAASLVTVDDVALLGSLINANYSVLSVHVRKYVESPSDKQTLRACLIHLNQLATSLRQQSEVTPSTGLVARVAIVDQLLDILSTTTPPQGDTIGDNVGLTSGFRQMYD